MWLWNPASAVVTGRNNKIPGADGTSVVVTTICTVHNLSGKIYLFLVVPFHTYGV